jgi:hypothetical protein
MIASSFILFRQKLLFFVFDNECINCGYLDGRFWSTGKTKNSKSQITNIKQITMTKIQNSKPFSVIWYWNLGFVCNLVLGICYFAMLHHSITPALFCGG